LATARPAKTTRASWATKTTTRSSRAKSTTHHSPSLPTTWHRSREFDQFVFVQFAIAIAIKLQSSFDKSLRIHSTPFALRSKGCSPPGRVPGRSVHKGPLSSYTFCARSPARPRRATPAKLVSPNSQDPG
jgi:hypothetical protein